MLDLWALLDEIDRLRQSGIAINANNLMIADNVPLILPWHSAIDNARELQAGKGKIGTTCRGIGPVYEDKVARRGIRISDLYAPVYLMERLQNLAHHHNVYLHAYGFETIAANSVYEKIMAIKDRVIGFVKPLWAELQKCERNGQSILFEGAQGGLLDIDYGTYPFVTSSNTVAPMVLGSH